MLNPKPTDGIKKFLAGQIHSDLKEKGKVQNYVYSPMENRLINNWLIKIKGRKEYLDLDVTIYQTSYMASNFGAYVFNTSKDLDFEKELTN